jgi:hypothetical protein
MNLADRILAWFVDHVLGWVLISGLVALFVVVAGLLYVACWPSKNKQYYSLDQSQWICSQSHQETIMVPMLVGKTTMIMPETSTVCTQFSKK